MLWAGTLYRNREVRPETRAPVPGSRTDRITTRKATPLSAPSRLAVGYGLGALGSILFACIAMSAAAAVVIAQFLLTHPVAALAVSPNAFACSLFLAIGATVIPSFLMNAALHRISAQANAVIGTLSPIATIALAAAILGEVMTGTEWIGAMLIMAGVGWFTLMERK